MLGTTLLALVAGVLSTLSPCVLPLIPVVLGAAAGQHRLGPVALATGVALSFTAIGLFVATVGFSLGLDGAVFRNAAAVVTFGLGVVLLVPPLQVRFAQAAGPVGHWVDQRYGSLPFGGLGGQFGVGLLLGAVWSPCVGPTLGAASVLAAQGTDLWQVTATMVLFGIGAALPLLLLGWASREALAGWRGHLGSLGGKLKSALGLLLIVMAVAVLSGLDKHVEAALVDASPDWLTGLTTRF